MIAADESIAARLARIERMLGLVRDDTASPLLDDAQLRIVHKISRRVCFEMGLSLQRMLGASRERPYARARAAVCWLAHRYTEYSDRQIGMSLGDRDRTTVLHYRLRGETLRQRDPAFRMVTDRIFKELEGELS